MTRARRPSPALAVATLALLLACAGSASAARDLMTGKGIKDGSITGVDIKQGSLPLSKLRSAPPTGARGDMGPQGATGPTGGTGSKGDAGGTGDAGIKGDPGPSDAWVGVAGSDTPVTATTEGTAVIVATTTVAKAGPLLLLGTLTASAPSSAPDTVTCLIVTPGGATIGSNASEVGFAPSGQALRATIAVQATATVVTTPAAYTMRCYISQTNVTIQHAVLTAISVGALH